MNKLEPENRFIFTGTPGSGKTSVILALKRLGYVVIPESATDVIAKEQAKGTVSPWEQTDFVDKIVLTQKLRQLNAQGALQFYEYLLFLNSSHLSLIYLYRNLKSINRKQHR